MQSSSQLHTLFQWLATHKSYVPALRSNHSHPAWQPTAAAAAAASVQIAKYAAA